MLVLMVVLSLAFLLVLFMARRAIPMIAFPRVRSMFIYLYVCVTYVSMRCIRS